MIKAGESINIFFKQGNPNNMLVHIRAIVDENQVVFRWWSKYKRRWIYQVESMFYFELLEKKGNLIK